jgi:putative transcriptional regulator
MVSIDSKGPDLLKNIREQLGLSQEGLARELGVSFATVNRWENNLTKPSQLAKVQLNNFCTNMIRAKKLKGPDFENVTQILSGQKKEESL